MRLRKSESKSLKTFFFFKNVKYPLNILNKFNQSSIYLSYLSDQPFVIHVVAQTNAHHYAHVLEKVT